MARSGDVQRAHPWARYRGLAYWPSGAVAGTIEPVTVLVPPASREPHRPLFRWAADRLAQFEAEIRWPEQVVAQRAGLARARWHGGGLTRIPRAPHDHPCRSNPASTWIVALLVNPDHHRVHDAVHREFIQLGDSIHPHLVACARRLG